jgi:hypothetical protein
MDCNTEGGVVLKLPMSVNDANVVLFSHFNEKVGGHSNLLVNQDKIAKPCNPNEAAIYQELQKDDIMYSFVPKYYGKIFTDRSNVELRYFQTSGEFILIENLTYQYKYPSVMDLKLGSVRRQLVHFPEPRTYERHGFRICGMRAYQPHIGRYLYHQKVKKLPWYELVNTFERFLSGCTLYRTEIITLLVQKLEKLLNALVTQQKFNFMGSSILLIFEGDVNAEVKADVRLIDFDHTVIGNYSSSANKKDSIQGIKNVIRLLEANNKKMEGNGYMCDGGNNKGIPSNSSV